MGKATITVGRLRRTEFISILHRAAMDDLTFFWYESKGFIESIFTLQGADTTILAVKAVVDEAEAMERKLKELESIRRREEREAENARRKVRNKRLDVAALVVGLAWIGYTIWADKFSLSAIGVGLGLGIAWAFVRRDKR